MKSTVILLTLAVGWVMSGVDMLNGGRNDAVPEATILSPEL